MTSALIAIMLVVGAQVPQPTVSRHRSAGETTWYADGGYSYFDGCNTTSCGKWGGCMTTTMYCAPPPPLSPCPGKTCTCDEKGCVELGTNADLHLAPVQP